MKKKDIVKALDELREYLELLDREDYDKYGAGIAFSIGWIKSYIDRKENKEGTE